MHVFAPYRPSDVSEKENRSYHTESRELNLPLLYVCRVEI